MFNLNDKTALITGASGGIGAEIARALHAQGADVVLHGTRQAKLEELANELVRALMSSPLICQIMMKWKRCLPKPQNLPVL